MIYLDTAALMKMIRREQESDALADWLDERPGVVWLTSTLTEVELPRALRRVEPDLLPEVPALLERVARYEIDLTVRATAAKHGTETLRSLDAIHLATAQIVLGGRISAFVTYDRRLLAAAESAGMSVACPGAPDLSRG